MIDADLAALDGVPTKRLNEQVRRNAGRFPEDFCSQLSPAEKAEVVANCDHLAQQFKVVFDAIRQLMALPAEKSKRKIGFV